MASSSPSSLSLDTAKDLSHSFSEVHVIIGPMFAGKTTALLRRIKSELNAAKEKYGEDAYQKLDVIGIDEAQFFVDLYEFCCKAADEDGKTVIVAGLDGEALAQSFT
ncbi:hypothetical protein GLYMA_20G059200v4 [Glycine max]|nr:hypothetical protein GLYMA_20G059200v4 [Glycine max]KAH1034756.1 hypothetical protein GYH30_054943 [Glycine max]